MAENLVHEPLLYDFILWYNTIILYYMLQGDALMLDFTAIDFETANKYANSACSLAAVTVRGNEIAKEAYTLIRPPFMSFFGR